MAGSNKVIGGGGWHHVAIKVKDFDASVKFYADVLGFKQRVSWRSKPERVTLMDTGDGNYLEIFEGGSPDPRPEGVTIHFAFRSDDVDAAINRARSMGAPVHMEPKTVTNLGGSGIDVRLGFIKGPDGELIEFFHSKEL